MASKRQRQAKRQRLDTAMLKFEELRQELSFHRVELQQRGGGRWIFSRGRHVLLTYFPSTCRGLARAIGACEIKDISRLLAVVMHEVSSLAVDYDSGDILLHETTRKVRRHPNPLFMPKADFDLADLLVLLGPAAFQRAERLFRETNPGLTAEMVQRYAAIREESLAATLQAANTPRSDAPEFPSVPGSPGGPCRHGRQ